MNFIPPQLIKQKQLAERAVLVYTTCIASNLQDERLNTRNHGLDALTSLLLGPAPPASYAARTRAQNAVSAWTRKPVHARSAAVRRAAVCAASVRAPCANPGVWFFALSGVGMPVGGSYHIVGQVLVG